MSIIKSISVGNGDMFYIRHNSHNFTIIDCNMSDTDRNGIINEIKKEREGNNITRVISTHPDEDHIHGLKALDEAIGILNFYCVENKAIESDETPDFQHYCKLRDGVHHYYVYDGCERMWLNKNGEEDGKNYGSSGIHFIWPKTTNSEFKKALELAAEGKAYNNLSPIFTYSVNKGVKAMWMGDMEHDFLEKVKDDISWPEVDLLFAPHHGRESGKVSSDVLKKLDPQIIIIGEAPSKNLDYYAGYNNLTQNSAGDIIFDCDVDKVYVCVENKNYKPEFLKGSLCGKKLKWGYCVGSFVPKGANK